MQLTKENAFLNIATHYTNEKHKYLKLGGDIPEYNSKTITEKNRCPKYATKEMLKKISKSLESRQVVSTETGIFRNHILDKHIKLTTRKMFDKKVRTGYNSYESRIILYDYNQEITEDDINKMTVQQRIFHKSENLKKIINMMLSSCKKEIENFKIPKNFKRLSDFSISIDEEEIMWRISLCECCSSNLIPFSLLKHRDPPYYTNAKNLIIFKGDDGFWNFKLE